MISFWFRKSRKVVTIEAVREEDTKGVLGVDMDTIGDEDMEEVEKDHPLVLTMVG
jgi:hypothetical protein